MKKIEKRVVKTGGFWKIMENLLFPRRCPLCDDAVSPFLATICKDCEKKIVCIKAPYCLRCGKKIKDKDIQYCKDCSEKKHYFIRGVAVFEYTTMASSIYRFKYAGRQEYADFYGKMITKRFGKLITSWSPQAIIPVPIHPTRRRKRGYNQSECLAKVVGEDLGIPVINNLIKRSKNTVAQKQLSEEERQNNLKKAFKICRNDVELNTIVIIDDIYTTGSTIDAMAMELQKAGIQNIYFVTLAIGRGF